MITDRYTEMRRARTREQRATTNERQAANVASRSLNGMGMDPQPGFWLTTAVKGGPLVPSCIRWIETTAEPGNPDNDMAGTRSPHLAGFILHEAVSVERVWFHNSRAITEEEYHRWMARWDGELVLNPKRRVDLLTLPPIAPPRKKKE